MSRILSLVRLAVWAFVPIVTPAFLTILIAWLIVWLQTVGEQRADTLEPWQAHVVTYGIIPTAYFVSLFLLTDQSTRRLPCAPALGLSLGIATLDVLLFHFLIGTYFGGLVVGEVIAYTMLALVTGLLAGVEARRRQLASSRMQQMVSSVSKTCATGGDAQKLMRSIVTYTEYPDLRGAMLWKVTNPGQTATPEIAYWAGEMRPSNRRFEDDENRLSEIGQWLAQTEKALLESVDLESRVSVLLAKDCPNAVRELYGVKRFAGVVVLPLQVHNMQPLGVLMVGFGSRNLIWRWQFRTVPDQFIQLADTIALTLQLQTSTQELLIAREKQARTEAEQQTELKVRSDIRRDLHHASSDTYQRVIRKVDGAMSCVAGEEQVSTGVQMERTAAYLQEAKEVYRAGQSEIRELVGDLARPTDRLNELHTEIHSEIEKLGSDTGAYIDCYLPEQQQYLSRTTKKIIVDAVREAFTNVRKHADPSIVAVSLSYFDNEVVLDIYNDGIVDSREHDGFKAADSSGIGMESLNTEVRAAGGNFSCGAELEGWIINISLPPVPSGR